MKNIFSPIPASWWVLDSFRPPEPKNVWFLLSRHDVRRVHENFFLADTSELLAVLPISASWAQKRLFVRRIHEKIFSGRFERTDGC